MLTGQATRADRRAGFTLIEVLLVLGLMAIVATLIVPRFPAMKDRAYYAAMRNDLRNLAVQMEFNYDQFAVYPAGATTGAPNSTQVRFRPSPDVVTTWVTFTSPTIPPGYTATATHARLPGNQSCTMSVGATFATQQGGLTCTTPTP